MPHLRRINNAMKSHRYYAAVFAAVIAVIPALAFAGRPLSVDDASVNERGNGHVEFWYADNGPDNRGFTIAPAYAPMDRLEVSLALARNSTLNESSVAAQAKFLVTQPQKSGCNLGLVTGASKVLRQRGETIYGNTLLTCNVSGFALHLNGGAYRSYGESPIGTCGVAAEREFGALTAHLEAFGERGSKPTLQLGARGDIAPKLQLDATLGRRDSSTLFSLGMKFAF